MHGSEYHKRQKGRNWKVNQQEGEKNEDLD
jgi:hypothetical protein